MTKEEKKVRNQEKRAVKKASLKAVLDFVKENTEDANLLASVAALIPGNRVVRSTAKDVIAALFVEKGTVNEMDLFTEYKLGRAELRKIRVNLIKKAEPADRLWVEFNADTGVYALVGQGAEAPEGWTGYVPVTIEDMELE